MRSQNGTSDVTIVVFFQNRPVGFVLQAADIVRLPALGASGHGGGHGGVA